MRHKQTVFGEIVLHVITAALKPLSAREIQEGLSLIGEETSLNMIYRHLHRLELLGLVKREDSKGKLTRYFPAAVSKFTVCCTRCGKSSEVHLPSDPYLKRAVEEATGFTLGTYSVVFDGVCGECRIQQDHPTKKYRIKPKLAVNTENG